MRPVRAHVKGFRLSDTGHRPRSSRLMNSAIDIESGGAVARINTTSCLLEKRAVWDTNLSGVPVPIWEDRTPFSGIIAEF